MLAISRRSLSELVTDVLVERGDEQVVLSTAENRGAKFSTIGFNGLVRRSEGDDRLAACVGSRPEIPPHLFRMLLAKASASVRAKAWLIRRCAARSAEWLPESRTALRRSWREPERRAHMDVLRRRGQLDDGRMEAIAKVGRFEEIAATLAVMSELRVFVERAINGRAEMVLIIAKGDCAVMVHRQGDHHCARVGGRPISGGEITQCLASYERLKASTAHRIVRFHRIATRARRVPDAWSAEFSARAPPAPLSFPTPIEIAQIGRRPDPFGSASNSRRNLRKKASPWMRT